MFAAQTGLGFVNPVTIAGRRHLYPSRTQKLSSPALRILGGRLPGKVGRCRFERKGTIETSFLFSCLKLTETANSCLTLRARTYKISTYVKEIERGADEDSNPV